MNELKQLQKELRECTARMTARAANIEGVDKAAGLGDEGAEVRLVGLQKQQERDQASLERMDRRIQRLEAGEDAVTQSRLAGFPMPSTDRIAREGWDVRKGLAEVTRAIEDFASGAMAQERIAQLKPPVVASP